MEDFRGKAAELGIVLYVPSFTNDAALVSWYKFLLDNDEFEKLFTEAFKPLSKFLRLFEPPTVLAFGIDEMGEIWSTMWFTPFAGHGSRSAAVSAWVREDMRGSPKAREAGGFCYFMAFGVWDTLISITRQEGLLRNLRQIGYNIVGSIPSLIDGDEAWVLYLTKENLLKSPRYGEK